MSLRRAVLVLGAVATAHAGYYLWPVGIDRQWAFYVLGGAGFAMLCLASLPAQPVASEVGALAAVGCWWGALEGLQQSVCGLIEWSAALDGRDLCVRVMGEDIYQVAVGLLAAVAIVRLRQRR